LQVVIQGESVRPHFSSPVYATSPEATLTLETKCPEPMKNRVSKAAAKVI